MEEKYDLFVYYYYGAGYLSDPRNSADRIPQKNH